MWKTLKQQTAAPLIYIFLIALAVRLIYVVFFFGLELIADPDSAQYLSYTNNLLAGLGYTDGQWRAFRAPGYPIFIAAVYSVFGQSVSALKLAQVGISSMIPVIVYLIGTRVAGKTTAILAGLFACFYFGLVDEPARLLSEAVFTFLFALSILFLLDTQKSPAYAAAAGAALALTSLARPVGLLLTPLALLWVAIRFPAKETFKIGALGILTFAAVMSPWWVRNYRVFGEFVPVCIETGYVLKHTNVPAAQLNFHDDLPEYDRDKLNLKEAVAFIWGQELSVIIKKDIRTFLQFLYPFMPAYDLTYAIIFPFWLLGVYFTVKTKNVPASLLFSMFLYFPIAFFFCGTARHRHSMGPYFILLAAVGAEELLRRIKGQKHERAVWAAIALWTGLNIAILIYSEPVRLLVKSIVGT